MFLVAHAVKGPWPWMKSTLAKAQDPGWSISMYGDVNIPEDSEGVSELLFCLDF